MIINKTQFDRWACILARVAYCIADGKCPEEFLRHALSKELLRIFAEMGIGKIDDYRIDYCNKCNKYTLI